MPWYATTYAVFLAILVVASLVIKSSRGDHLLFFIGMVVSAICSIFVFCAYWIDAWSRAFGLYLLIPLFVAITYDAIMFDREFRREIHFLEIPPEEEKNYVVTSIGLGLAIMAPAWFLGALAAFRYLSY